MDARAQVATDPSVDSGVTVDLSVLEDNGYNSGPVVTFPGGEPRQLLVPNAVFPKSALHVPVPGKRPAAKHTDSKKPPRKKKPVRQIKRVKTVKREAPSAPTLPPKPPITTPAKIAVAPAAPPVEKIVKTEPAAAKPAPTPRAAEKKPAKITKTETKIPPPPPSIPTAAKLAKTKTTQAQKGAGMPNRVKIPPKTVKKIPKTGKPLASKTPSGPGPALRIGFKARDTKLSSPAKKTLKSLANKVRATRKLRLQLRAFAGGESLTSSRARRLSLSRALSVRSYLIENGIRSTRIDVRALGDKTTIDPINRVDVTIVER